MMNKIKILHMPLVNTKGGVEQYVLKNSQFIDSKQFQFDIVTRSKNHNFLKPICQNGGKILTFSHSSDENEQQFRKEMSEILNKGYDVVHLHTSYWKGFLVEELAREMGVSTIIVHAHSTAIDVADDGKRKYYEEMHEKYKKLFRPELADYYLACSRKAGDWIFGNQIPREKILIMNNAIDLARYHFDERLRQEKRKEQGWENKFVIGNVARFSYQKNHEFLIEMLKETKNAIPQMMAVLIGDGPLREAVEAKVMEEGLNGTVCFYGEREDVADLLQAMDLFVLPSRFEGLPITLIEAQAAGLPCLVYENITKEADITGNVIFLPYDLAAWCWKAEDLFKHFQRTGVDAKIKEAGYDIRKQIIELENIYRGCH